MMVDGWKRATSDGQSLRSRFGVDPGLACARTAGREAEPTEDARRAMQRTEGEDGCTQITGTDGRLYHGARAKEIAWERGSGKGDGFFFAGAAGGGHDGLVVTAGVD
jgi:hypothetical protein